MAVVMAIRDKLGTKECFPDIQRIVREVEQKVGRAKTLEDKKSYIKVALEDFDYVVESSAAMYKFLKEWRSVDDPAPFVSYLEAADRTKTYLAQYLAHLELEVMEAMVVPPPPAPAISSASAVLPTKVASTDMDTAEVAAYIKKAVSTVRHYITANSIPYHRTHNGGFPFFRKEEIDAWRLAGDRPSTRRRRKATSSDEAQDDIPRP